MSPTTWRSGLDATTLPPETAELRAEVRRFLGDEAAAGAYEPRCDNWLSGIDPAFSRKLGAKGWIGMALPSRYGGHDRTPLERFVVTEELLAAGAPVAAHWFADRQMGPNILRHGTEAQKQRYLPAIARGECYFAIGMSEPDAGSDLAAVRTRATRTPGGWKVTGSKVWTSGAHVAHAIVVLLRTSPRDDGKRHEGLSQFVVDLPAEGVDVRPIVSLDGRHHFNEVVFDEAFVPEAAVLGEIGQGWRQVTGELAFERSGPERVMTTLPALGRWADHIRDSEGAGSPHTGALGRLVARLWVLRQMSLAVAGGLAEGRSVEVEAALVKDLGTLYERELVEVVRECAGVEPDPTSPDGFTRLLADAVLHAPGFTLRGGTNEVLRGVVARALGAR